jgi:hypothetical protein
MSGTVGKSPPDTPSFEDKLAFDMIDETSLPSELIRPMLIHNQTIASISSFHRLYVERWRRLRLSGANCHMQTSDAVEYQSRFGSLDGSNRRGGGEDVEMKCATKLRRWTASARRNGVRTEELLALYACTG